MQEKWEIFNLRETPSTGAGALDSRLYELNYFAERLRMIKDNSTLTENKSWSTNECQPAF